MVFSKIKECMLEQYEQQSTLMLLGGHESVEDTLDLSSPRAEKQGNSDDTKSDYNNLFD